MAKTKKAEITTTAQEDLTAAVNQARETVRTLRSQLVAFDLARFTADERVHSNGRLRDGEAEVMVNILDTIDAMPGLFAALANRDHGSNPNVVETAPARAALDRRAIFAPLAADLQSLATEVSDDVLASAELARDVTQPAYAIAKANAAVDDSLRKLMSPALDYYARSGRRRRRASEPTGEE